MTGTMSERDAAALRQYLGYSHRFISSGEARDPAWDHFGPLSFDRDQPSLCGLNDWPAAKVARSGNLAERDYSVEDVGECLSGLVAVAPTMLLVIHCGGERESTECVATIRVGEGLVAVGPPEVQAIEPMSDAEATVNMFRALTGGY
jgi:hypothetical protein